MERKAKVICSIVGFLGLLAAVLGFTALAGRKQLPQIDRANCTYVNAQPFSLGLIAAGALLVTQIIVSTATGCFCCRQYAYRSISTRILAGFCFVISWITFVSAFFMFLYGATHYARKKGDLKDDFCIVNLNTYYLQPWVFTSAALLSLVTVALGIVSYLALDSAKTNDNPWGGTAAAAPNQGGIAMAQPQFPSDNPWAGTAADPKRQYF